MGLTRSAVIGLMTWGIMTVMHVKHELAIGVGIFSAFLAESMIQANARSHLRHKATSLQTELNIAIDQICDMKRALDVTSKELRSSLHE